MLTEAHCLHWIENPQQSGSSFIVIDHYAPAYTTEVGELLTLSGLPAPTPDSAGQVILPVFLALDGRKSEEPGNYHPIGCRFDEYSFGCNRRSGGRAA